MAENCENDGFFKPVLKFGFSLFPTASLAKLERNEDLIYFCATYGLLKAVTLYTTGFAAGFYLSQPRVYRKIVTRAKGTIRQLEAKTTVQMRYMDKIKLKAANIAIEWVFLFATFGQLIL